MSKIIQNYILQEIIGSGQYGEVFRAINMKTNQQFAIKTIKNEQFRQVPKLNELTTNEITILSTINNAHVVKFFQILRTAHNVYLVYQFCNGGNLEEKIKKNRFLGEDETMALLWQILDAFRSLNDSRILHRDVKPANILFHDGVLKLADFGFCQALKFHGDLAKSMVGSPIYMAPEALKGEDYGQKADVWSLGVLLYQTLFGLLPFQQKTIVQLINKIDNETPIIPRHINNISPQCQKLLMRMLTKNVQQRVDWNELFQLQEASFLQSISHKPRLKPVLTEDQPLNKICSTPVIILDTAIEDQKKPSLNPEHLNIITPNHERLSSPIQYRQSLSGLCSNKRFSFDNDFINNKIALQTQHLKVLSICQDGSMNSVTELNPENSESKIEVKKRQISPLTRTPTSIQSPQPKKFSQLHPEMTFPRHFSEFQDPTHFVPEVTSKTYNEFPKIEDSSRQLTRRSVSIQKIEDQSCKVISPLHSKEHQNFAGLPNTPIDQMRSHKAPVQDINQNPKISSNNSSRKTSISKREGQLNNQYFCTNESQFSSPISSSVSKALIQKTLSSSKQLQIQEETNERKFKEVSLYRDDKDGQSIENEVEELEELTNENHCVNERSSVPELPKASQLPLNSRDQNRNFQTARSPGKNLKEQLESKGNLRACKEKLNLQTQNQQLQDLQCEKENIIQVNEYVDGNDEGQESISRKIQQFLPQNSKQMQSSSSRLENRNLQQSEEANQTKMASKFNNTRNSELIKQAKERRTNALFEEKFSVQQKFSSPSFDERNDKGELMEKFKHRVSYDFQILIKERNKLLSTLKLLFSIIQLNLSQFTPFVAFMQARLVQNITNHFYKTLMNKTFKTPHFQLSKEFTLSNEYHQFIEFLTTQLDKARSCVEVFRDQIKGLARNDQFNQFVSKFPNFNRQLNLDSKFDSYLWKIIISQYLECIDFLKNNVDATEGKISQTELLLNGHQNDLVDCIYLEELFQVNQMFIYSQNRE